VSGQPHYQNTPVEACPLHKCLLKLNAVDTLLGLCAQSCLADTI
jgi:hypothetical protein